MSNEVLHWLVSHVTQDGTVPAEKVADLHAKIDAGSAPPAEPEPEPEPVPDVPVAEAAAEPDPVPVPEPDPEPAEEVTDDAPAE